MPLTASQSCKLYRQRNPERWKESIKKYQKKKYTCECGCVLSNKMRPTHLKSKKHQHIMEMLNKAKSLQSSEDENVESEDSVEH